MRFILNKQIVCEIIHEVQMYTNVLMYTGLMYTNDYVK